MKTILPFLLAIIVLPALGQKMGNGYGVSDLSTQTAEARMLSQIRSMNRAEPIGSNQFRNDYTTGWQPVRFEVYPNPAHNWLAADFPANQKYSFCTDFEYCGSGGRYIPHVGSPVLHRPLTIGNVCCAVCAKQLYGAFNCLFQTLINSWHQPHRVALLCGIFPGLNPPTRHLCVLLGAWQSYQSGRWACTIGKGSSI
jgi:hypothetical protein